MDSLPSCGTLQAMRRDEFTRTFTARIQALLSAGVTIEEIHDRTRITRDMIRAWLEGQCPRDEHSRRVVLRSLRRLYADRVG